MADHDVSGEQRAAVAAALAYRSLSRGDQPHLLPDHQVADILEDETCRSGFRAVVFKHTDSLRIIIGLCGCNELIDFGAAATMGLSQYLPNRDRLLDIVTAHDWAEVLITGHSLGGALAQYLAYDIAISRPALLDRIELRTFNALGGLYGLSRLHGQIDDDLARRISCRHYAHPDDVICRIGGNLAGMVHLLADDDWHIPPLRIAHGLAPFLQAEAEAAFGQMQTIPDRPFEIARSAERAGPVLLEAALAWIGARRLLALRRLAIALIRVPPHERRQVLQFALSLTVVRSYYRWLLHRRLPVLLLRRLHRTHRPS